MEQSREEAAIRANKAVKEWTTILTTAAVSFAVTFAILVVVLKFVWAWVAPDLFPVAVAQGLISADLSWLAVLKLAVLVGLLSGIGRVLNGAFKRP